VACTDSDGNDGVGHGIKCLEDVGAVGKRDDGRVPRIAQDRKARGPWVFSAAESSLMGRLVEKERDMGIAQEAPRTF
jgi:hypothetical protein